MKRTNLVLDENLLEEATRLAGERTYSRTVERALEDFVRRIRAGRILELANGTVLPPGALLPLLDQAYFERAVYRPFDRGAAHDHHDHEQQDLDGHADSLRRHQGTPGTLCRSRRYAGRET